MKIKIEGYKNIACLEHEIEDDKLNVLIGISGSGKSAIIGALTNQDFEFNKKINYTGNVVSQINGLAPENISVFNEDTVEKYLFSSDKNDNIYTVLIDDEQQLLDARKALDLRIQNIQRLIDSSRDEYQNLKQIQAQLGAALTTKNKIKNTSAISKMKTSIVALGKKQLYRKIVSLDENKVNWIIKGVPWIEDSTCPFCGKHLSNKKEQELHKFTHIDLDNRKKINLNAEQLTFMKTSGVQLTINGLNKLESEIIDIGIALKEYDKLVNDVSDLYDTDLDVTKINLVYEPQLFTVFPSLKDEVKTLNKQIIRLQNNVTKAIENTKSILNRKIDSINGVIERFGIPFKIEAIYKRSKITSYKLYHIDDANKLQREKGLSSGEKKIISLIFFMLENSKKDFDLIVFDDPVSSYDENRRLSIFTYMLETLKNRTVLILSHDQLFAKFAVGRSKKQVGKIEYFDNYGSINVVPIDKTDFEDINTYIRNQLKVSNNYIQKIINLRFYYELNRKGLEYSYLSRILHKENVLEWLTNKNIDENSLVEQFKKDFKIDLETFNSTQYTNIDTSTYTLVEKMFLLREKDIVKKLRDELSNHIHMNSKYAITLNPYKFSFCSKYVYDALNAHIQSTYNM